MNKAIGFMWLGLMYPFFEIARHVPHWTMIYVLAMLGMVMCLGFASIFARMK